MSLPLSPSRIRWLVLLATWSVCSAAVVLHTSVVRDYIDLLNGLGLRGAPTATTPLREVIPARYADAQMWVRHAITAAEAGELRVRSTKADNAPIGREVHWSSAVAWLLRAGSTAQTALSGQSGAYALERTLWWLNAPILIGLMVLLSAWTSARAGTAAGVVLALGMIGHGRFYEAFAPANVDHHGLVGASLLGLLLGVNFMGTGYQANAHSGRGVSPSPAHSASGRRAAVISGLCGAAGLWLSAAATVPVIAFTGVAGLVVAFQLGPTARLGGAAFDPGLWRLWGQVGAGASLAFYLIEYAPAHFSLRLEVNHPLYAAAWWGGAEIVAQIAAWRRAQATGTYPWSVGPLVGAIVAMLAVPLTILVAGRTSFSLGDPFIGALRHFVAEGRSLPAFVELHGFAPLLYELGLSLVLLAAAVLVIRRRNGSGAAVALLALVNLALLILACFEVRWRSTAAAAQIALLVAIVTAGVPCLAGRHRAWIGGIALLVFIGPAAQRIVSTIVDNHARRVAAGDLLPPLYRDVAGALRESQPQGDIVLLASPNASAGIAYFGRFAALGTLYWENASGLRAAAEVFSAPTDDEAFSLLRKRRVTHLALISTANFLGEYHRLLNPAATVEDAKRSFGYRLASQRSPPPWLQPVPYRPPADLRDAADRVRLYKVAPDQTEVEWLYHTAVAHLAGGEVALAEKTLAAAIARAPETSRAAIESAGGREFYEYGADAIAVRLLQRALARQYDSGVALTTAWVLATSDDAAVRDGIAALMLAEPVAQTAPADPSAWSAVAAAQAELGRFPAALAAAERALDAARSGGDPATIALLQQRLETIRSGRPWRR